MEGNTISAIPTPPADASAIPSILPPPSHPDGQTSPIEEPKQSKPEGEDNSSAALSMIGDILKQEEEIPASLPDPAKELKTVHRQESATFMEKGTPPASSNSQPFSQSPQFRAPPSVTYVKQSEQVSLMNVKPTMPPGGSSQKLGQQQVFTEEDPFGNSRPQQNEPQKKDT